MNKHIIANGIIFLLIMSIATPITIGNKLTKFDNDKATLNNLKQLLNNPIDSSWPMYQHDAAHTGFSEGSFPDNFSKLWFKSYQGDLGLSMISLLASPATSDGKIFITGDGGNDEIGKFGVICALNQSDGGLVWKKELPLNKNAVLGFYGYHSPAVYDGKVFTVLGCFISLTCKSKVVALDENTGDVLWEKTFFGTSYYPSVTVADGKVFVCGHMTFFPISWLYVFDVGSGDLLWQKKFFGYVESTPAIYGNKVFVTPGRISGMTLTPLFILPLYSGKSSVYALNIDDGQEIWMKKIFGHLVQCSPAVVNGRLFVPSNIWILKRKWVCRISALDVETGEEVWHHDMDQKKGAMWPSSISTPSLSYGKVFVTDSDGWLRAWNQDSGDLIFEREIYPDDQNMFSDVFASPVVVDGKVIVGANAEHNIQNNEFLMFNESTGEYIWNLKFGGDSTSPFVVSDEMLYVNDGWNGIYALG